MEGEKKREEILGYQEKIKSFTDTNFHKPEGNCKKLLHEKPNQEKELLFSRKTLG